MKRHSVLIIDDEVNLLKSLATLLKEEFHIHTAPSGKEGLMLLSRHPISMVLLDLNMPDMNGIEVLEKIRRKDYTLKVVIMTGARDYDWSRRCADLAVQGFIEKPIDPPELLKRIKKIVSAGSYNCLQAIMGRDFDEEAASLNPLFKETLSLIEQKIHQEISREDLSAALKVSPDYLSKLFMNQCGINLNEFINRFRIEKSREYLQQIPFMKIKEVAKLVGISDPNYYCRLFKKHSGMTPTDFQKKTPPLRH